MVDDVGVTQVLNRYFAVGRSSNELLRVSMATEESAADPGVGALWSAWRGDLEGCQDSPSSPLLPVERYMAEIEVQSRPFVDI